MDQFIAPKWIHLGFVRGVKSIKPTYDVSGFALCSMRRARFCQRGGHGFAYEDATVWPYEEGAVLPHEQGWKGFRTF